MLIELRVIRVFNWVPRDGVVTAIDVTDRTNYMPYGTMNRYMQCMDFLVILELTSSART